MLTRATHPFISTVYKINIFLLAVLLCVGCKDDKLSDESNASAREIYLDDFEENPFKWGYINKKGEVSIKAIYDDNRDFSEGLAAANYEGLWGYINKRGEVIIDFQYRTATAFSEGLAIVQMFDREYITIDKEGKVISKGKYDEQYPYSNGRSRIKVNDKYGYLNTDGIRIDTVHFLKAGNFKNNTAIVQSEKGYFIIDTKLKPLTSMTYYKIYPSDSRFWKYKKSKKYGYLDAENNYEEWLSDLDRAGTYEDGIACISKNGVNYIINEKAEKKEIPYPSIRNLSHGRVAFSDKGKYGVLDRTGKIIAPEIYDGLYKYADNRIGYQKGELWGYLDMQGKEVMPPLFPLVWDYQDGMARAITSTGIGFIDTMGRQIIPPKFVEVRDFYEGLARVQVFR